MNLSPGGDKKCSSQKVRFLTMDLGQCELPPKIFYYFPTQTTENSVVYIITILLKLLFCKNCPNASTWSYYNLGVWLYHGLPWWLRQ